MIRVGTSGFSYPDWAGVLYPPGTPKTRYLETYAASFDALELNATFYRLPALKALQGMVDRTPPGFTFAVKAPQAITHARGEEARITLPRFHEALKPFAAAGKLGAILFQFPWSFKPAPDGAGYVERLRAEPWPAPPVMEFRHAAWFTPERTAWAKALDLATCGVDEPRLPGLPAPAVPETGPVLYVRMHGRNAAAWFGAGPRPDGPITPGPDSSARYRYRYAAEELREWVPRLGAAREAGRGIFVFFNNHPDGNAVLDARAFRGMLADEGYT